MGVSFVDRLKDWQPRKVDRKVDEHFDMLWGIGDRNGMYYFNPTVTGISSILIWGFIIWAMTSCSGDDASQCAGTTMIKGQMWVTDLWNWFYMISQNIWIVVLLYMMVKHWNLKLGKDDEKQEFDDVTWFAMLFSCGVATGLWYFTAEGMWHYENEKARFSDNQMFNDNTKAEQALMLCLFHWGPHGWIPYSIVGAVIAIMSYRRGYPMSMRFTLYPLIGEMCYGVIGDFVEVLSVCCTLFGVCTSLGLGARQIAMGLVRLDKQTFHGVNQAEGVGLTVEGTDGQFLSTVIILIITAFATASVVAGLEAGIAQLASVAFAVSFFIVISVLFMDETWYILNAMTSALGYYLWYLPKVSFHTDAWEEMSGTNAHAPDGRGGKKGWTNSWTMFYWGWWISWGPFCGTFLARISRGRTLGTYIMGSLIVPSIWSFLFLGIFGAAQIRITNEAINAGLDGGLDGTWANKTYGSIAEKAFPTTVGFNKTLSSGGVVWETVPYLTRIGKLSTEDVVFEHLSYYGGEGFSYFFTLLTLSCIVLYFVTSSDSASFVVDMMAANGIEEPPLLQKIFWCTTEGAAAISLLWSAPSSNPKAALDAVQALPIILGLPLTFILFWVSQAFVILCAEESGQRPINRKNFRVFIFNFGWDKSVAAGLLDLVVATFCPFIKAGEIAEKIHGKGRMKWTIAVLICWVTTIVFAALTAADSAFSYMACCLLLMDTFLITGLRVACRSKLGITGDILSDALTCFFYPCALTQMAAEDFEQVVSEPTDPLGKVDPAVVGSAAEMAVQPAQGKI